MQKYYTTFRDYAQILSVWNINIIHCLIDFNFTEKKAPKIERKKKQFEKKNKMNIWPKQQTKRLNY